MASVESTSDAGKVDAKVEKTVSGGDRMARQFASASSADKSRKEAYARLMACLDDPKLSTELLNVVDERLLALTHGRRTPLHPSSYVDRHVLPYAGVMPSGS